MLSPFLLGLWPMAPFAMWGLTLAGLIWGLSRRASRGASGVGLAVFAGVLLIAFLMRSLDTFAETLAAAAPWLTAGAFAAMGERGRATRVAQVSVVLMAGWLAYFLLLASVDAGFVPRGAWTAAGDAHIVLFLAGALPVMALFAWRIVRAVRPRPTVPAPG